VDGVRSAVAAAVDEGDVPAGHFSDVVAAFAGAASIDVGGESTCKAAVADRSCSSRAIRSIRAASATGVQSNTTAASSVSI
jgi:hypothetical protein